MSPVDHVMDAVSWILMVVGAVGMVVAMGVVVMIALGIGPHKGVAAEDQMSLIDRLTTKWREKRKQRERAAAAAAAPPIVISTPWGPVSESARAQAAANLRADPAKRAEVVALLAQRLGSAAAGEAEARRRYPESFDDDGGDGGGDDGEVH